MSDPVVPSAPPARESKSAAIIVAAAVGVSAVGVAGWHLLQNRGEDKDRLDVSGFDLAAAPTSSRPAVPLPSLSEPAEPASSLGMLKADAGIRIVGANSSGDNSGSGSGASDASPAQKRKEAALSFQEAAKKHEKRVHAYFLAATRRHPSIRQYGRDWMSYPDLKKLNDDYFKDRDPVRFMYGLSKSENFGKLVKKYATDPAIRAVVIDAAKQAPSDIMAAGMDYLQNDRVVKDLVGNVAKGMGLPSSMMALFDDKGGKVDQNKIMGDIMKNNPDAQRAMEQQGGGRPSGLQRSGIQVGQ